MPSSQDSFPDEGKDLVVTNKRDTFLTDSEISLESEKSYDPLYKKTELYETFTYLTFNLLWMFIAAFANVILFVLYTYERVFDTTSEFGPSVLVTLIICNLLVSVDVCSAIVHSIFKQYAVLRNLPPRSKILTLFDVLSIAWLIVDLIPSLSNTKACIIIGLIFVTFRLYRVMWFFYIVSKTSGLNNISMLLQKYGIILFLAVHILSCIWQTLGCCYFATVARKNWTSTIEDTINFDHKNPFNWYLLCSYYMLGCVISTAFGDIHAENDYEYIISIIAMVIGLMLIVSAFLGAWTSVQIEDYRRHSIFSDRLKLIASVLSHESVPKMLRTKIMNFYYTFWKQRKGIHHVAFFGKLPVSIKEQVYLDKYWYALNQTYILKHLPVAFLRALSSVLLTEIYTTGEAVYIQGQDKSSMIYILRGDVKLLSAEDGESPLLTLAAGTCIGEINLFYSFPNPVQLIASSYCIIQRLQKEDFWRIVNQYRRLHQTKVLFKHLKTKIKDAYNRQREKKIKLEEKRDDIIVEKALKSVKNRLKVEDPKLVSMDFYEITHKSSNMNDTADYSNLYILSLHQTTLKHSDEIFLHGSWPWILQPYSVLLTIWEYCVCLAILMVVILYPYHISFTREFPSYMLLIGDFIDIIYLLDIVVQIFTAVEQENGILSKVSDIFTIRCRDFSFTLDVLAVLPIASFASIFQITQNKRLLVLLTFNRLLKLHRVVILLKKLGASFNINVALVRCIKYVVYFLLVSYFMGSIFYMLACFNEQCSKDSWFTKIKEEDLQTGGDRYKHSFELSLYFAVAVISQAGFGDIKPYNMVEVIVTMIFFIIGTLLFCYLVADFTATLILANQSKADYIEMVNIVRAYLMFNKMLGSLQYRTNEYLTLQWRINCGYYVLKKRAVLFDVPQHLYEAQKLVRCVDSLKNMPIFQDISVKYINKIAAKSQPLFLSPNEIVINAGGIVKELFIIDRGFCEVISAVTGKVEKILGPKSFFCDFDMLLELPGIYVIRTVTNVHIIKIVYNDIRRALSSTNFEEQAGKLIAEIKASMAGQRLFLSRGTLFHFTPEEEKTQSWFIFPRRKLDPRHIDYERAFKNIGFKRFFKPLLMRRAAMPNGKFLMIWEIIQSCRIFLMGMCFISMPIILAYFRYADFIVLIILEGAGYLDMYIRMHTAFYNNKGILVTHPRYTAYNYFTGAFATDFIGLLPTAFILRLVIYAKDESEMINLHYLQCMFRLNRLILLYRVPKAFSYFERDLMKTTGVLLNIVKMLPVTLIFLNALTNILITISCTMFKNEEGYMLITAKNNSWIMHSKDKFSFDVTEPINLYITAYYWIVNIALSLGLGDITATTVSEMYLAIFGIISGYLLFTYIVVIIFSRKASINVNLTLYQDHMKHLIKYMKQEKISDELQEKVIDHFEYIWQRKHGMEASNVLKKCHLALREDLVYNLFENTFEKIPIFEDVSKCFYRVLGLHVEETYHLKNSIIIKLNDIIYNMYIIHNGEVTVVAPDGTIFAILTRGSIFGNIDNIESSRSMTTVISNNAVDLLSINTKTFYDIALAYPIIINKLQRHVLLENTSYIAQKYHVHEMEMDSSLKIDNTTKTSRKRKFQFKSLVFLCFLPLPIMISSFISCIIVLYHLAFQSHSYTVFILTYACDVFHFLKVYIDFYRPYLNNAGELVTDYRKIRERYLNSPAFYLELAALLPFEIFSIAAPIGQKLYYLSWLRINRILRLSNIHNFFNVTFDRLNINVLIIKLESIFVNFTLTCHIGACLLYMIACPGGICSKTSWIFDKAGNIKCGNNSHYLCSFYFMMSISSSTAFGDYSPRTIPEIIICVIIMLSTKFIMAVFVGDITSIVQSYSYTLVTYDYNKSNLKEYLKCNYISIPLINRVMNYVDQLWEKERGQQFPVLLKNAPNYLVEDIKAAAYGKHLYENYVFVSCHVDFLRLLNARFKVHTFFKGNIVCQQGDINDTMYFIHKGFVNMYDIEGDEEVQIDQLKEMDCFGLVQGLFASTPHSHTYRAATVSIILSLYLHDWAYLLYFYRAARFDIYERIQNMADTV